MIVSDSPHSPERLAKLQARFVAVMPAICRHLRAAFARVQCPHRRAERVAEGTALCWRWFLLAAEHGRDVAPVVERLVRLAVRAVNRGVRLCGRGRRTRPRPTASFGRSNT